MASVDISACLLTVLLSSVIQSGRAEGRADGRAETTAERFVGRRVAEYIFRRVANGLLDGNNDNDNNNSGDDDDQVVGDDDDYHIEESPELFEGDILPSPGLRYIRRHAVKSRWRRNSITRDRFLWPGGVVPILFEDSYPDWARSKALKHLAILENKVNADGHCVKALPISRSDAYLDHLLFLDAGVCASAVGFSRLREQRLELGLPCLKYPGHAQHEFIHALGIQHEQTRMDRDDYVTIVGKNVIPRMFRVNFGKYNGDTFGLPYDYGSLMHYPAIAFSVNNEPTIITKNGESIGNRMGPSDLDVERIRQLYQCKGKGEMYDSEKVEINAGLREAAFVGGSAGAVSWIDWFRSDEYAPARAFQRQTSSTKPWFSAGKLPQALWYRFPNPITVGRFSFRNQRGHRLNSNDPVSFSFVGADNCATAARVFNIDWVVIKNVTAVEWTNNDQLKGWDIPIENRRRFSCFGFMFYRVSNDGACCHHVAVHDVRMWKETALREVSFSDGEARAYSHADWWESEEFAPKRAFERQRNSGDKPWLSVGRMPQAVWFEFPRPIAVARFGFRNRREHSLDSNDPVSFAFVGAADCGRDVWQMMRGWEIVKTVENVTWTNSDQLRLWDVEEESRRSLGCFGFLFYKVSNDETCCQYVAVQDIKMWEETDNPTEEERQKMKEEEEENLSAEEKEKEENEKEKLTPEQEEKIRKDLKRIRLVNEGGANNQSGRLEVLVDGRWGSVCDDAGDNREWTTTLHTTAKSSKVVCSMYGYSGVGIVVNEWDKRTGMTDDRTERTGENMIWTHLNCEGNEISLFDCPHSTDLSPSGEGGGATCQPHETLGIYCF